jgi:hypothetical protein
MKPRLVHVVAAAVILLAAALFWRGVGKADGPEDGPKSAAGIDAPVLTKPKNRETPAKPAEVPGMEAPKITEPATGGLASSHETILAEIQDAAVTYDAKALPRIQPYLLDSDPAVREAAIQGMIILGDAAAGPMLREASRHAKTPQEAVKMLEAADYVELPSGTLPLKKRGAGPPPPAPGK